MGGAVGALKTAKNGHWTAEEKYELNIGISNQRKAAEFASEYMFYGVPVTCRRATEDPISPLWIQVDTDEVGEVDPNIVDDKMKRMVPTTVMALKTGIVRAVFSHSGIEYEFTVKDIDRAMDPRMHHLPDPSPPILSLATSNSLTLLCALEFPGGITQRVEMQYAHPKQQSPNRASTDQSERRETELQWLALATKGWEGGDLNTVRFEDLGPGKSFLFRMRYFVPRGWSDWSIASPLLTTKATVPDRPVPPFLGALLPDAAQLCWVRPRANGAPITSFVLRGRGIGYKGEEEAEEMVYTELYRGPQLHHLALRLVPEAAYSFEVAACNSEGQSAFSLPLSAHTPSRSSRGAAAAGLQQALACAQAWREMWDPENEEVFYFNVITSTRQVRKPDALILEEETRRQQAQTQNGANRENESDEEVREKDFRLKRFRLLRTLLGQNTNQQESSRSSTPVSQEMIGTIRMRAQMPDMSPSPERRNTTADVTDTSESSPNRSSSNPNVACNAPFTLSVRRDQLLWDVYRELSDAPVKKLRGESQHARRRRTRVQFLGEAGIDAGGLCKEMYMLASQALVSHGLKQGWLVSCNSGALFFKAVKGAGSTIGPPNKKEPTNIDSVNATRMCALFGRLCGLAVLDRQMVMVPMTAAWLQQMLTGEGTATLDQLCDLDETLVKSLQWMLQPDVDIEGIIDETFSVADPTGAVAGEDDRGGRGYAGKEGVVEEKEEGGRRGSKEIRRGSKELETEKGMERRKSGEGVARERRVSLCNGGQSREVTQENKAEYVSLVVKWHSCYCLGPLLLAFLQSFHELVPLQLLQTSGLGTAEMSQLLCGRPVVDVDLLRAHAVYRGKDSSGLSFSSSHFLSVWFWTTISEMDEKKRRALLGFITGSSSVPLDGFDPPLTLTLGEDMERDALPRAHTCFNQIVLPTYSNYETMREKIDFAVQNTEGFALS